ncbi:hypothetical protein EP232_05250 [bacterium]|nr:MAG: hypothetical protein EP232_05250 [bacterium]
MTGILVFSLLLLIVYAGIMAMAIAMMSPDYFMIGPPPAETWRGRHRFLRFLIRAIKGGIGLGLVISGIAMLVLPGQGLLTILIGVSLMEFPGKRRLERSLIQRKSIHRTINWIRKKAGREPVVVPGESGS